MIVTHLSAPKGFFLRFARFRVKRPVPAPERAGRTAGRGGTCGRLRRCGRCRPGGVAAHGGASRRRASRNVCGRGAAGARDRHATAGFGGVFDGRGVARGGPPLSLLRAVSTGESRRRAGPSPPLRLACRRLNVVRARGGPLEPLARRTGRRKASRRGPRFLRGPSARRYIGDLMPARMSHQFMG